ncbi:MAG TPA: TIGR02186 family protein [archaeon]|nr:TIGR02186 family protein [archaeon]
MRPVVVMLLVLGIGLPAAAQTQAPSAQIETRRVTISMTFSGQRVFLHGQTLPGTQRMLVVMEGPPVGQVRLTEKGRVGLFWLGVRQYKLAELPGVYLVNACDSPCDGHSARMRLVDLAAWNPSSASAGILVGSEAVRARARVQSLSGDPVPGEAQRILEGYWRLQADQGLYAIQPDAIRINREGAFYHTFALPTQAPEGKYRIVTYFLAGDRVLGTAENVLFVRKSGFMAWLTRLAERQALSYGVFTVLIAVTAGWLAGAIFKRGGGH